MPLDKRTPEEIRVDRFIDQLERAKTETVVKSLITKTKKEIQSRRKTVRSLLSAYTPYRDAVIERGLPKWKADMVLASNDVGLSIPFDDMNAKVKEDGLRVRARGGKGQRVGYREITDVDEYIEQFVPLLRAPSSYYDLIIGLGAVTGRRLSEVASTAIFTLVDDYTVDFRGQLKMKRTAGREVVSNIDDRVYPIPTLVAAVDVVDGLNRLREWSPNNTLPPGVEGKELKRFVDKVGDRVGNETRARLKRKLGPQWKIHDLRAAYAAVQIAIENDPSETPGFRYSVLLGHEEHDFGTGTRYQYFVVNDPRYRRIDQ